MNFQFSINTSRRGSDDAELFTYKVIEPNENRQLVFKEIEDYQNITVSEAIRKYVSINPSLKSVVETWQSLLIKKYYWEGSQFSVDQVNNYIHSRMFSNPQSFQAFIKRAIYFYVAEIGVAIRTNYVEEPDTGEVIPQWELIPSFDLVFTYKNDEGEHDPENGNHLIIGKRIGKTNRIEVLYDQSRSRAENMNFTYLPSSPLADSVFGTSRIAAMLNPVLSKKRMTDMLGEYLAEKIDPHIIFTTDMRDAIKAGLDVEKLKEYLKAGNSSLKSARDKRKVGENMIAPFPVETLQISGLDKDNLDGIEPILELYEPEILRAAGIPGFMLGGQRRTSSLNQSDAKYAILMLSRRLEQGVLDFNEVFTEAIVPIRVYLGINEPLEFKAQYDDTEVQAVRAMIAKEKVDALKAAVDADFIDVDIAKQMLQDNSFDFAEYLGDN